MLLSIAFMERDFTKSSCKGGNMRVMVDEEVCVGDGTCVEICPEMFEMKEDVAVTKMAEVPEELEDACSEAAESCPVAAIFIE
jgi:ferredoxin